MLFKQRFLSGIRSGAVTLAFRRWRRPTVRVGGILKTTIGVLAIESVDRIVETGITEEQARRAGYTSRSELISELREYATGELYRIEFRYSGPDPRIALREQSALSKSSVDEIQQRLRRLDAASPTGPWTSEVLRLIQEYPQTKASELATIHRQDTKAFKANVRKLKNLGLTESLAVGYRISPRGRAVLKFLCRSS